MTNTLISYIKQIANPVTVIHNFNLNSNIVNITELLQLLVQVEQTAWMDSILVQVYKIAQLFIIKSSRPALVRE